MLRFWDISQISHFRFLWMFYQVQLPLRSKNNFLNKFNKNNLFKMQDDVAQ